MAVTPARKVALSALRAVRDRDAWSHEALSVALATAGLNQREAAFATRLTYGTAGALGVLDEVIDRFASAPGRIEPRVRDALRLATYELLYEKTDAYVAVDQGVDAAGRAAPHAKGYANAILRRVSEEAATFPWGDPAHDLEAHARLTAMPGWLARRMAEQLGEEAARGVMAANLQPAPVYLAHNPFLGTIEDLMRELLDEQAQPRLEGPPGCIRVVAPAAALATEAIATGRAIVADAGAQLVAYIAGRNMAPDALAVDVAAGRGTKTALLQAAAEGHARVLALDIHEFKVAVLTARMTELNVPSVKTAVADATSLEDLAAVIPPGTADVVLVDAPCTGTGTLRRHPEKRWRLTPEDPARVAVLSAAMLTASASLVRPGGFVVYSTCSVLAEENQDVVSGFLGSEAGRAFETADLREGVPTHWRGFLTDEGWFRSLPAIDGPDGHFAARLMRRA